MKLTKANIKAINYACTNFHYSKSVPTVQYAYNVYNNNNEWCGVIIYGGGANNNLAKNFNLHNGEVLELERVALNVKQEQTSKAVALSLKLLHKENPIVKVIVSYADHRQNHVGTIYKATNWLFLGISKTSDTQYYYNGKWTHERTINSKKNRDYLKKILPKRKNSNKFKYIYCIDKDLKNKYQKQAKEYPAVSDLTIK
jgi:hypothetical protein